MFCSDFSQVHKFCYGDRSNLVPKSTQPGVFPSKQIVDNLHGKPKTKHLIIYIFLYIIALSVIVPPTLSIILDTIIHLLRDLDRLWYSDAQSLLLYTMVRTK